MRHVVRQIRGTVCVVLNVIVRKHVAAGGETHGMLRARYYLRSRLARFAGRLLEAADALCAGRMAPVPASAEGPRTPCRGPSGSWQAWRSADLGRYALDSRS